MYKFILYFYGCNACYIEIFSLTVQTVVISKETSSNYEHTQIVLGPSLSKNVVLFEKERAKTQLSGFLLLVILILYQLIN